MISDNTMISVYNRHSNGTCGYSIPELNGLHRSFASGETKKISMDELRKLDWVPGGHAMLENYLVVLNQEAVEELLGEVEPEYFYTVEDVQHLLVDGSLDELEDCLNFAPEGVKELVKDMAISLGINNTDKRKMIEDKTGFSVDKAIRANEEVAAALAKDGITEKKEAPKERKAVQPKVEAAPETPSRKTAAPKYKIIEDK